MTFEEVDFKPPKRMLRAVFADGSVIEGCAFYLRALGVSFLPDGALDLLLQDAALLGHHAAYGRGHDERVVRAELAGLKRMAA